MQPKKQRPQRERGTSGSIWQLPANRGMISVITLNYYPLFVPFQKMSKEILAKYNLLDKDSQKEVQDFLDFLLFKKNRGILFDFDGYRRKIHGVSTWSAEDINVFDENAKLLNQWQIEKW